MILRPATARSPIAGRLEVPASKSLQQRALVLAALADGPVRLEGGDAPGDDVRELERALTSMGRWADGAVGLDGEARTLDLGFGATGFRFATAVAGLRPTGARTLVTGRPALLRRPHRPLRLALGRMGGHVVRRRSGAFRVIAGGLRPGRVEIDAGLSSQFASALMLIGPRLGGLEIRLRGEVVSRPYLHLTAVVLRAFGIDVDVGASVVRVAAGAPRRETPYVLEADASSAAPWWAAAALTGGRVEIAHLPRDTRQADARLLEVLETMGASVEETAAGEVRVGGPGGRLRAAGEVDLRHAPDLLPLVGILAAAAEGETRVVGTSHAKHKESDRCASTVAGIRALGGEAESTEDGIRVVGCADLHGGSIRAAQDHRIVLAFGVLGLAVEGMEILGAEAVSKSYPTFPDVLAEVAAGR